MLFVSVFRVSGVVCFCVPRFRCFLFLCSAFQVFLVSVFRVSGVVCFCVPRFRCFLFLCSAFQVLFVSVFQDPASASCRNAMDLWSFLRSILPSRIRCILTCDFMEGMLWVFSEE